MVKVVTHVFVKCALRDICKLCWGEAILIPLYVSIMTIKGIHSFIQSSNNTHFKRTIKVSVFYFILLNHKLHIFTLICSRY